MSQSPPRKSSVPITDPDGWYTHQFADQVFETDHHSHSPLLGPDGRPLAYAPKPPLGFDLRPKRKVQP